MFYIVFIVYFVESMIYTNGDYFKRVKMKHAVNLPNLILPNYIYECDKIIAFKLF